MAAKKYEKYMITKSCAVFIPEGVPQGYGPLPDEKIQYLEVWRNVGIKTVITPCADCYAAFSVLYDKIGHKPAVEILPIT